MSKLFSGKRYFLKPIKQSNNADSFVNQSMQDILGPYTKTSQELATIFHLSTKIM